MVPMKTIKDFLIYVVNIAIETRRLQAESRIRSGYSNF